MEDDSVLLFQKKPKDAHRKISPIMLLIRLFMHCMCLEEKYHLLVKFAVVLHVNLLNSHRLFTTLFVCLYYGYIQRKNLIWESLLCYWKKTFRREISGLHKNISYAFHLKSTYSAISFNFSSFTVKLADVFTTVMRNVFWG